MRVAVELILRIDADIGDLVRARGVDPARINGSVQAEGADFERMLIPARLDRDAPVRREPIDAAEACRVDAQRLLRSFWQRAIPRDFRVDELVPEGIGA